MKSLLVKAENFQTRILSKYDTASLETRIKSKLILQFIVFVILLFPILLSINLTFQEISILSPAIILAIDTVLFFALLVLLVKGFYQTVVFLIFAILATTLIIFVVSDDKLPQHTLYYVFVLMAAQFLFGTRRQAILLMITIFVFTFAFYYWIDNAISPPEFASIRSFQIDFVFSLTIFFFIGILSMHTIGMRILIMEQKLTFSEHFERLHFA